MRAVALWALTKVFYAKAFDEGQEQDWWHSVGLAVDELPFIAKSWLEEQVRDRCDLSPETDEPDQEFGDEVPEELANEVLLSLVRDAAAQVGAQLRKALGETLWFAALMSSRSGDTSYPRLSSIDHTPRSPSVKMPMPQANLIQNTRWNSRSRG